MYNTYYTAYSCRHYEPKFSLDHRPPRVPGVVCNSVVNPLCLFHSHSPHDDQPPLLTPRAVAGRIETEPPPPQPRLATLSPTFTPSRLVVASALPLRQLRCTY